MEEALAAKLAAVSDLLLKVDTVTLTEVRLVQWKAVRRARKGRDCAMLMVANRRTPSDALLKAV